MAACEIRTKTHNKYLSTVNSSVCFTSFIIPFLEEQDASF